MPLSPDEVVPPQAVARELMWLTALDGASRTIRQEPLPVHVSRRFTPSIREESQCCM